MNFSTNLVEADFDAIIYDDMQCNCEQVSTVVASAVIENNIVIRMDAESI